MALPRLNPWQGPPSPQLGKSLSPLWASHALILFKPSPSSPSSDCPSFLTPLASKIPLPAFPRCNGLIPVTMITSPWIAPSEWLSTFTNSIRIALSPSVEGLVWILGSTTSIDMGTGWPKWSAQSLAGDEMGSTIGHLWWKISWCRVGQ